MRALRQGDVTSRGYKLSLVQLEKASKSVKHSLDKIEMKHNPKLDMIRNLFQVSQNYANKRNAALISKLFRQLLKDFEGEHGSRIEDNDREIEIFKEILKTNENIIEKATERRNAA